MTKCPVCQTEHDSAVEICVTCGQSLFTLGKGSVIASRYEIHAVLGQGGMGTVYEAHDRVLDEPVAIKVLRVGGGGDSEEMVKRFRSEIKLARKVSHPNVCRIHDYGEDGDLTFISMALLEGPDLKQRLEELPGGLPPEAAFDVAIQTAEGLKAIHDVGVIHRDLKTANVIVDDSGCARLMDFGIAKDSQQRHSAGLTAVGMVMGTPEYMSPEQGRGLKFDLRSDIYALGIVIFELFTGDVPFHGDSMVATVYKHIQEPPPFDGPQGAGLPAAVIPVLRKALAKEPDQRYASVAEMLEALREARVTWQEQGEATPEEATPAGQAAATPEPTPMPAAARPAETTKPTPEATQQSGRDRRRHERMAIPVDLLLSRLDQSGGVVNEERTIAENISRCGACVMTSMSDIAIADLVRIQEIGGDFETRATVRGVRKGADGICRLGLEFLDTQLPRRFLPADYATGAVPKAPPFESPPEATPPPASHPVTPQAAATFEKLRAHSRLKINVDLILKRLDATGKVIQQERTIADQVSRGGMRILTSFTGMEQGDIVAIEELDGDFTARAEVRHTFVGKDRAPRLGVKLLDKMAPDRLVPEDELSGSGTTPTPATARTPTPAPRVARSPAASGSAPRPTTGPKKAEAPAPEARVEESVEDRRKAILEACKGLETRNHFEVLGIPRTAGDVEVKKAYFRLVKKYHPDKARDPALADLQDQLKALFLHVGKAFEVLSKRASRGDYEASLGRGPSTPATQTPATPAAAQDPEAAAEELAAKVEQAIRNGKRLFSGEKYWDAIQLLEWAEPHASTQTQKTTIRLYLARCKMQNPKWVKEAEELLRGLVADAPKHAGAHFLLGSIYKNRGLKLRAQRMFRKVLELDPDHEQATAELRALGGPDDVAPGASR